MLADRLREFFEGLDFRETAPWVWAGPCDISLLPSSLGVPSDLQHRLRAAWRAALWRSHESSGRRDVTGMPYCGQAAKSATELSQDVQQFAVLSGPTSRGPDSQ